MKIYLVTPALREIAEVIRTSVTIPAGMEPKDQVNYIMSTLLVMNSRGFPLHDGSYAALEPVELSMAITLAFSEEDESNGAEATISGDEPLARSAPQGAGEPPDVEVPRNKSVWREPHDD